MILAPPRITDEPLRNRTRASKTNRTQSMDSVFRDVTLRFKRLEETYRIRLKFEELSGPLNA
jgi:hypothetical protein